MEHFKCKGMLFLCLFTYCVVFSSCSDEELTSVAEIEQDGIANLVEFKLDHDVIYLTPNELDSLQECVTTYNYIDDGNGNYSFWFGYVWGKQSGHLLVHNRNGVIFGEPVEPTVVLTKNTDGSYTINVSVGLVFCQDKVNIEEKIITLTYKAIIN